MILIKEFYNLYKQTGHVAWILLFSLLMPLVGTAVSIIYVGEMEALLTDGGLVALGLFLAAAVFLVGLSFLPSYILAILCGWIFGVSKGVYISLSGILLAAMIGYGLAALIINEKLLARLKETERYNTLDTRLREKKFTLFSLISLLRLSPLFPFAVTNILMASLRINLKEYIAGTFVGMLPRTILAVIVGSQLTRLNFEKPSESWSIIISLAATVFVLVIITRIAGKALRE